MHKCITVKIGGSKNVNLAKTRKLIESRCEIYKFCENRWKFINFVEIGGKFNMHHWLKGMDAPGADDDDDNNDQYKLAISRQRLSDANGSYCAGRM